MLINLEYHITHENLFQSLSFRIVFVYAQFESMLLNLSTVKTTEEERTMLEQSFNLSQNAPFAQADFFKWRLGVTETDDYKNSNFWPKRNEGTFNFHEDQTGDDTVGNKDSSPSDKGDDGPNDQIVVNKDDRKCKPNLPKGLQKYNSFVVQKVINFLTQQYITFC